MSADQHTTDVEGSFAGVSFVLVVQWNSIPDVVRHTSDDRQKPVLLSSALLV